MDQGAIDISQLISVTANKMVTPKDKYDTPLGHYDQTVSYIFPSLSPSQLHNCP